MLLSTFPENALDTISIDISTDGFFPILAEKDGCLLVRMDVRVNIVLLVLCDHWFEHKFIESVKLLLDFLGFSFDEFF